MRKSKGTVGKIATILNTIDLALTIKMTLWDRLPVAQRKRLLNSLTGAFTRLSHRGMEKVPFIKKANKTNSSDLNDISKN